MTARLPDICRECGEPGRRRGGQFCDRCAEVRKGRSMAAWVARNREKLRRYWHNRWRYGANSYDDLDAKLERVRHGTQGDPTKNS